jgi:hypothetical protein
MLMAERYNISHVAGDAFSLSVTYAEPNETPIDLTGCTAAMQIRDLPGGTVWASSSGAGATLTVTIPTPANGEILIAGTISQAAPASGYWDLQVTSAGGLPTTIIGGSFTITHEVTA